MPEVPSRKRKKYWSEMTIEEKQEELIAEVMRTQNCLKNISEYLAMLAQHIHHNDKIVMPIHTPGEEIYGDFHFRVYNEE